MCGLSSARTSARYQDLSRLHGHYRIDDLRKTIIANQFIVVIRGIRNFCHSKTRSTAFDANWISRRENQSRVRDKMILSTICGGCAFTIRAAKHFIPSLPKQRASPRGDFATYYPNPDEPPSVCGSLSAAMAYTSFRISVSSNWNSSSPRGRVSSMTAATFPAVRAISSSLVS